MADLGPWRKALSAHRARQRAQRGRRAPRLPDGPGMTVKRPAGPECEHRICEGCSCLCHARENRRE